MGRLRRVVAALVGAFGVVLALARARERRVLFSPVFGGGRIGADVPERAGDSSVARCGW